MTVRAKARAVIATSIARVVAAIAIAVNAMARSAVSALTAVSAASGANAISNRVRSKRRAAIRKLKQQFNPQWRRQQASLPPFLRTKMRAVVTAKAGAAAAGAVAVEIVPKVSVRMAMHKLRPPSLRMARKARHPVKRVSPVSRENQESRGVSAVIAIRARRLCHVRVSA